MDTGHDILRHHEVLRRRLTRAEYYRMGEVGILHEDDRVELLEGQLVQMSPVGPRHAYAIDTLNELLVPLVLGRARVRVQQPVFLDDGSEPQPDVALVRLPAEGYRREHPRPGDVLLLIEVADSSRDFDLGAKRAIYAQAGIREFWVVDLTCNEVVVCRAPEGEQYASIEQIGRDGKLTIEALAGVSIKAGALFG